MIIDINKLVIHELKNGANITTLMPHGLKFSDGTNCQPQDNSIVQEFTIERKLKNKGKLVGMQVNEILLSLNREQLENLKRIQEMVDIVIVPLPVLIGLKGQGLRDLFRKCVAYNATISTMRSAPQDKIVDIHNWSY